MKESTKSWIILTIIMIMYEVFIIMMVMGKMDKFIEHSKKWYQRMVQRIAGLLRRSRGATPEETI